MNSSLPERLKIATRALHAEAERSPFMASLLRGQLDLASYREMLVNFLAIYVALEAELERHRAHPAIAAIRLDGIARAAALTLDIAAIGPLAEGPSEHTLRPSAKAYVERLHAVGDDAPQLLVAHAYVRYLGDLSGGQILGRIVAESMGAPTAFYEFGAPENAQALRAEFRAGLVAMQLDAGQSQAIVHEAVGAFERHVALFEELRIP